MYGTSYLIGKIEIEELIAPRVNRLGDAFDLRSFMDAFSAAGVIPVTLIDCELTAGSAPETRNLKP